MIIVHNNCDSHTRRDAILGHVPTAGLPGGEMGAAEEGGG